MKRKMIWLLLLAALLGGCTVVQETATASESSETTEAATEDTRNQVEELKIIITAYDYSQLSYYTNLKKLDLSGSVCYAQIEEFIRMNPDIEVTYTIDLGGAQPDSQVETLTLQAGEYDISSLVLNLQYLRNLQSVTFEGLTLTRDEMTTLQETYPDITFTYTLTVLGTEYDGETTALSLPGITSEDVDTVAPVLARFTKLETVDLMDGDSCALSMEDVKKLVDAVPDVRFHYTFTLFGQTISTDNEIVTYKNVTLDDDDVEDLRAALSIMSGCDAFILDGCNLSSEELAAIREDYDNTELTWRIHFGNSYSCLTNKESIRAVYHVDDSNVSELKYCRKAKYIDMGHNETLSDLSFVGYMPDLEILIVSGCSVKDLSGFENCKKLEFLELAYCGYLSDITPLAECTGLKYLNISYTKVSDLSALDALPLERLFCTRASVGSTEQNAFLEIHPDCWTHFGGTNPYGIGWRYDDKNTYSEIYKKIREIWDYDKLDKIVKAQEEAAEAAGTG